MPQDEQDKDLDPRLHKAIERIRVRLAAYEDVDGEVMIPLTPLAHADLLTVVDFLETYVNRLNTKPKEPWEA